MTGAAADQVPGILKGFTFIPLADQLARAWLGGAAANMKTTADFLVKAGRIDAAIDDYSAFVNTAIAEAAQVSLTLWPEAGHPASGSSSRRRRARTMGLNIKQASVVYPAADGRAPVEALAPDRP